MTSGFTSGFASVLTLVDQRRVFVKAAGPADDATGWSITGSYREEARKRAALPGTIPAPQMLWSVDDDGWIINGFEYAAGRLPRRPWEPGELAQVVSTVSAMSALLDPAPPGLDLPAASTFPDQLDELIAAVRDRDGCSTELGLIETLAREWSRRSRGDAVLHFDLRDDNIILADDGRVLICDWNWPMRGAPWIDLVCLLLSVHGDGLDADAILTANPLTCDVDPRSIDSLLGVLWLYFTTSGDHPVPPSSPHLRAFQRLQGRWVLSWLRARGAV